jgi:hypothetical protein
MSNPNKPSRAGSTNANDSKGSNPNNPARGQQAAAARPSPSPAPPKPKR